MNKTKQNMLWNSIGSIVYFGSQWVLTVLVVRVLGYGEGGVFSLAMSLTNTFYALANYGVRNFQVSDINGQFSDMDYIYNRCITNVLAGLGCVICCLIQGYDMHSNIAISGFMAFRFCESFQDVLYGIEQKNSNMKNIGVSNILKGIIGMIMFTFVMFLSKEINVSIYVMLLVMLLVLVLYDIRSVKPYIHFETKAIYTNVWKILWVCAPIALNNFVLNYILTYPKLIIEEKMGAEALGIYTSISTPVLIVQMLSSYLFAPFIVIFTQLYHNRNKRAFYGLFIKVVGIIGLVGIAAIIGAKIGAKYFLNILYGDTVCQYIYIIYPLILCTVLTAVVWFLNALIIIERDYLGLSISSALSLLIIIVFCDNMVGKFFYNGASWTLSIVLCVKILIMLGSIMYRTKDMNSNNLQHG